MKRLSLQRPKPEEPVKKEEKKRRSLIAKVATKLGFSSSKILPVNGDIIYAPTPVPSVPDLSTTLTDHHDDSDGGSLQVPQMHIQCPSSSSINTSTRTTGMPYNLFKTGIDTELERPNTASAEHMALRHERQRSFQSFRSLQNPSTKPVNSTSFSHLDQSKDAVRFLANFADRFNVTAQSSSDNMYQRQPHASIVEEYDLEEGDQIGDFIRDYVLGPVLSAGGFSVVRECVRVDDFRFADHHPNHDRLVMRSLECKRNQDPSELNEWDYNDAKQRQEYFERELRIWKKLKHPTILPLLESFETVHRMYTVSRYCLEGNALGLMQRSIPRGGVDMLLVRHIVKCTAVALQYMHNEARIIHGDVKLENIFLDPDKEAEYGYRVYVSDFGLAQEMDTSDAMSSTQERQEEAPLSGSIPYCSPERLQAIEPQLTQAMDAWGLGVVAYALVFSQLPFHDDYEPRLVMKILEAEIDWGCPRKDISTALDCIAKLLLVDVDERWSIHQALTSLWLS